MKTLQTFAERKPIAIAQLEECFGDNLDKAIANVKKIQKAEPTSRLGFLKHMLASMGMPTYVGNAFADMCDIPPFDERELEIIEALDTPLTEEAHAFFASLNDPERNDARIAMLKLTDKDYIMNVMTCRHAQSHIKLTRSEFLLCATEMTDWDVASANAVADLLGVPKMMQSEKHLIWKRIQDNNATKH